MPRPSYALAMKPNIPSPKARLRGEVVYFFAYDIAYELSRDLPPSLLGHPIAEYRLDASKRNPKHLVFYRPRMVRLPPEQRLGPHGLFQIQFEAKILPIGAISIRVRVPFEVERLADLGVLLVGIDTASIDPADSKTLPSHQVIRQRGLRVLENLLLDAVPEGDYELIALPLKLMLADASPVRAILRDLP